MFDTELREKVSKLGIIKLLAIVSYDCLWYSKIADYVGPNEVCNSCLSNSG